jgi:hypothetical protein
MLDELALIFLNPVKLPGGARLWTFLPLALCVATVYRATRVRNLREMPRGTLITWTNIVVGMSVIALAFYLLHEAVLKLY